MSSVQWDGSPLTVRDIRKIMPDVMEYYSDTDNVLYVKTAGNPHTPVPLGWYISRAGDGMAEITENG